MANVFLVSSVSHVEGYDGDPYPVAEIVKVFRDRANAVAWAESAADENHNLLKAKDRFDEILQEWTTANPFVLDEPFPKIPPQLSKRKESIDAMAKWKNRAAIAQSNWYELRRLHVEKVWLAESRTENLHALSGYVAKLDFNIVEMPLE